VADTFTCPPENQQGLDDLRTKLERGEDVNPHLSAACRDADDPNFHDRLLNDWDIQHLHLGPTRSTSLVERSRNVLFARITPSTAYLIAILDHRHKDLPVGTFPVWFRTAVFETLHRNWPESIAHWREDGWGVEGAADSDADVLGFRGRQATKGKNPKPATPNFTYLLKLSDASVYFPVGGGSTMSGHGTHVIHTSNWYSNRVAAVTDDVAQNRDKILDLIRADGGNPGDPPHFHFHLTRGLGVYVTEAGAPEIGVTLGRFLPTSGSLPRYRFRWA